jgi:hypothetical protein
LSAHALQLLQVSSDEAMNDIGMFQPIIDVEIEEIEGYAMLDTASAHSFISNRLYKEYFVGKGKELPSNETIKTDRLRVNVIVVVTLKVKYEDITTYRLFRIIEGDGMMVILGRDFICAEKITIDLEEANWTLTDGRQVQFRKIEHTKIMGFPTEILLTPQPLNSYVNINKTRADDVREEPPLKMLTLSLKSHQMLMVYTPLRIEDCNPLIEVKIGTYVISFKDIL